MCAARELPEQIPYFKREELSVSDFQCGDIIIDALLGIGFTGTSVRGSCASFIRAANSSGNMIVALDVPSGVDASTGIAAETAVRASYTIMFGAVKSGLLEDAALPYCGVLRFADIGFDLPESSGIECYTQFEAYQDIARVDCNAHKNSRPSVLIFAGCRNYSGAAQLNMHAALRAGAGMVRLVTSAEKPAYPLAGIIFNSSSEDDAVYPADAVRKNAGLFEKSDVLLAGSGWGYADKQLITDVLKFKGPVVLDADALNALSRDPDTWSYRSDAVLTPHYGEAVRLAGAFGVPVTSDRRQFALALSEKLNCVVVLKGPHTITAWCGRQLWINTSGCSKLATAGSGDVLAGVIASAVAGASCAEDICRRTAFAVWVHGVAGEISANSLIADDLPLLVGRVMTFLAEKQIISL